MNLLHCASCPVHPGLSKKKHLFIYLLFTVILFSCQKEGTRGNFLKKSTPAAHEGVLDLRNWDFEKDGPAELNGMWEFYWQKLPGPSGFQTAPEQTLSAEYIKVPGLWNSMKSKDKKIGGKGYGTYRLTVLLPEKRDQLGLKLFEIYTAYTLLVNQKKLLAIGKTGKAMEQTKPDIIPNIVEVSPDSRELEIVIGVSNFHLSRGGIWTAIKLGNYSTLKREREKAFGFAYILFGCLLIMALYHLFLFLYLKKNHSLLFFGLTCLCIAIRILFTGERVISYFFPSSNWELTFKISYLTYHLTVTLFGFYVYNLFTRLYSKKILYFLIFTGAVYTSLVLTTSAGFYTRLLTTYHVITVFYLIYTTYVVLKALKYKKVEARMFIAGWAFLFLTTINDILFSNYLIHTAYIVPYGLFIFLFSQTLLLSRHFSLAFLSIEKLSNELDIKNKNLSRLDKLKDEFLANTSHELRTPLNGIVGIAESLLDKTRGSLAAEVGENLSLIITNGRRLVGLINDILDFSRLKNQDLILNLQPVDMRIISALILRLLAPLAEKKGLELVNTIPPALPAVLGDENRLCQIIQNLVGNAIKFTESGKITISAEEKGAFVKISVTDTGIGVPGKMQEKIFNSFEQVDGSDTRLYGGTGIGLSVTKHLVELHGGFIKVRSAPGQGSVFSFTIPISGEISGGIGQTKRMTDLVSSVLEKGTIPGESLETRESPLTKEEGERQSGTILAADDDHVNRKVLHNILSVYDYRVIPASNGEEVLQILQSEKTPDLVLLDIMMPRMSGYEVCRRIRETYSPIQLPVILLTAKDRIDDLVLGFEAGANDYLAKPFSKRELLSRIRTHLKIKNQHFELQEKNKLQNEMEIACNIQTAMLPEIPSHNELEISALMKPADKVGGDYYDILQDNEGNMWFGIGDVSGHGVTPGLIMMMAQTSFSAVLQEHNHILPGKAVCAVNKLLYNTVNQRIKHTYFMSINLLKYEGKGSFIHAGAHIDIVIYRNKSAACEQLETGGPFMGMMPDVTASVTDSAFKLEEGDIMLLITDGIIEARQSSTGRFFDFDNLTAVLTEHAHEKLDDIKKHILTAVLTWCDNKQKDDITMVLVRRIG